MNKLDELIAETYKETVESRIAGIEIEEPMTYEKLFKIHQDEAYHKLTDYFQKYNTQLQTDDSIKILKLVGQYDKAELEDCISQLISIFNFSLHSPTQFDLVSKLFLHLCWSPEINAEARLKLADTLFNEDESRVISYQCYSKIIDESGLNLVLRIRAIGYLFSSNSDRHMEHVAIVLDKVVSDPSLHSDYVMKTMGDLLATFQDNKRRGILADTMWTFLAQSHHEIAQKILACIYLLENRNGAASDIMIKGVFIFLMSTMNNKQKTVSYNQQADAADAVDRYGNAQQSAEAKEVLKKLGGNQRNVYENEQSAHAVSESAIAFLEKLKEKKILLKKFGQFYEGVKEQLTELAKTKPKFKKIERRVIGALDRITSDTSRICGMDLREIAQRIYDKIYDTLDLEHRNTRVERFFEELAEAYGTCTSGHVNRLVNVFEGGIKISFEQQIMSNYEARFNTLMRGIEDDELKGNIMVGQMMVDSEPAEFDDEEREAFEAFHAFIKKHRDSIQTELHREFVGDGFVKDAQFKEITNKYFASIKF